MFSTMVHELAHEQLHWGDRRESTSKAVRETEAEAVAYVVCRAVGPECSTRASDYTHTSRLIWLVRQWRI